jgi:N-acetylmuramoyl-L-alanine amidase
MTDFHKQILKRWSMTFLVIAILFSLFPIQSEGFTAQIVKRGAVGDDVIELQARLQYIGYYRGQIDGVFGWGTYWSVRNFQNDFGLDVDGLVGAQMKQKLAKVTKYDSRHVYSNIYKNKNFRYYGNNNNTTNKGAPPPKQGTQAQGGKTATPVPPVGGKTNKGQPAVNIPRGFTANDIKLMANAVYGEARGEPYRGQVAIAAVILNRVKSPEFPNTVSGVIFEPRAFTAVADGQIWLTPNETAKRAVTDAINGWDPTGGLVFYFNPATATSKWMHARPKVMKIGRHVFLK